MCFTSCSIERMPQHQHTLNEGSSLLSLLCGFGSVSVVTDCSSMNVVIEYEPFRVHTAKTLLTLAQRHQLASL